LSAVTAAAPPVTMLSWSIAIVWSLFMPDL
jgi:hypothetical protein